MTKEELDKSRKTANKANIARVDLDWHPAAFRAFVPPGIEQANRKPVSNSIGLVPIMFGLLTAIVMTICWEEALCLLTQAWNWGSLNSLWLGLTSTSVA